MGEHVKLTMDGREVLAEPGETILLAARRAGIEVPALCYMEGRRAHESCGVCMVRVEGRAGVVPACATRVENGMVVETDTEELAEVRRLALDLLLSDHVGDCMAPCQMACPAKIDIQLFLELIGEGRHADALDVIRQAVAFPGVLGRICPKPCETACRRGELDEPIAICAMKRFPADLERERGRRQPPPAPATGRRVAIVGGGIAGLTAAYYLLLQGHACTVFDARPEFGGVLRHRIPPFRLPAAVLDFEVEAVRALGAVFAPGRRLGDDLSFESLVSEYDAVLLATGAPREIRPDVPGADLAQSVTGLVEAGPGQRIAGRALVFGSGPGAAGVCRFLLRAGASAVTLMVDRPSAAAGLLGGGADEARAEGVEILTGVRVGRIERAPAGELLVAAASGALTMERLCDRVFFCPEFAPDPALAARLGLDAGPRGLVVDRRTLQTSRPGVFAAGAAVGAGNLAVVASASGSLAALSIGRYLAGQTVGEGRSINCRLPSLSEAERRRYFRDFATAPRATPDRLEPAAARATFDESDRGLSESAARAEAGRCFHCGCARRDDCLLREYAGRYGASPGAYAGARVEFDRETSHGDVVYEPAKCIKCGKCILIAREQGEHLGLTQIGRGFTVKVAVPFGESLAEGLKTAAERCAEVCPTGALVKRRAHR